MNSSSQVGASGFLGILMRAVVVHTVTYAAVGIVALVVFDYTTLLASEQMRGLFRPLDSPWVTAGPLIQPLRGVLFGIVFYLLREGYFGKPFGWVTMWVTLVFVGILGTFAPAPGSIEGLVYTTLPVGFQFGGGFLEVLTQSALLSWITFYWVNHAEQRWLTWILGVAFALLVLLFAFVQLAR